mgnify:CR=1 FL=1
MTETSTTMKWFAIKTMNNREKSVLERLKHEAIVSNFKNLIGRSIIPTEKVYSIKNGKKVAREKIVYPGYLFIETGAVGEVNNILKGVDGASGFVKERSGNISPLKDAEVRKLLNEQEENNNIEVSNSIFIINEEIKIIDGPFSTFKGKIQSVDSEKKKLKVEVMIFNRSTMVELEFSQVER